MTRTMIFAALTGGLAVTCTAPAIAETAQELVSLRSETFVDRCNERGILSGGGSSYTCAGSSVADRNATVSCVFTVQGAVCRWPDASDAFARSLIYIASSRSIGANAGFDAALDLNSNARVLLPSFGGRRAADTGP